jgi:hypothetical protein
VIRAYLTVGTVLFLVCAYAYAQTKQFHEEKAMKKDQRALESGRIWSKKCAAKNMDVLASKTDNGPWIVKCLPKRTLQVGV